MTDNRFINRSELIGILVLAALLVVILPLFLDVFRLNLVREIPHLCLRGAGPGDLLGVWPAFSVWGRGCFRARRLLHGDVSQARSLQPGNTKIQSTPAFPISWTANQITELPFFWQPFHSLT